MGAPKGNKYAVGNKGGAPTKYTPELIAASYEYLENYKTEYGDEIPSIVGLAVVLGVWRDTLHSWVKDEDKKEFSLILKAINDKQQNVLLNKGLSGAFNPAITKLVLGKHGYHDKQDTHVKEFAITIGNKDADTL